MTESLSDYKDIPYSRESEKSLEIPLLVNFILVLVVTLIVLLRGTLPFETFVNFISSFCFYYVLISIQSIIIATITLIAGKITRGMYIDLKKVIFRYAADVQVVLICLIPIGLVRWFSGNKVNEFSSFEGILVGLCLIYIMLVEHSKNPRDGQKVLKLIGYYMILGVFIPIYVYLLAQFPKVLNPFGANGSTIYVYSLWWYFGLVLGVVQLIQIVLVRLLSNEDRKELKLRLKRFYEIEQTTGGIEQQYE